VDEFLSFVKVFWLVMIFPNLNLFIFFCVVCKVYCLVYFKWNLSFLFLSTFHNVLVNLDPSIPYDDGCFYVVKRDLVLVGILPQRRILLRGIEYSLPSDS
jgi:hypothetical protein